MRKCKLDQSFNTGCFLKLPAQSTDNDLKERFVGAGLDTCMITLCAIGGALPIPQTRTHYASGGHQSRISVYTLPPPHNLKERFARVSRRGRV